MLSNSMLVVEPKSDSSVRNLGNLLRNLVVDGEDTVMGNSEVIGVVEVQVHRARDIHNICIYHKQDVYAKLCMTSDPDKSVSTQIINGGGTNPVFDENLSLDVRTIDSSVKCEIWMFSRVRNYLEDQLLGFALVPLSDVLVAKGKLARAFPLSACDLVQTPSGSVELSLAYSGASPQVMDITSSSLAAKACREDSELATSVPCEFNRIEFPDPKIVNENHMMVSECFGTSHADVDSQRCESLSTAENEPNLDEIGVRLVQCFSNGSFDPKVPRGESPQSSDSTIASASVSTWATSESSHQDMHSVGEIGSGSSPANMKNEEMVVQQEIVEMYLKSMQQFSASLVSTGNESVNEERKLQGPKGKNSRLFYGSRAFF